MILESVKSISGLPVSGVKLQLLHILKGTDLADYYQHTAFPVFSMEEYVELVIDCLEYLSQDIVIHRLTGDELHRILFAERLIDYLHCASSSLCFFQSR